MINQRYPIVSPGLRNWLAVLLLLAAPLAAARTLIDSAEFRESSSEISLTVFFLDVVQYISHNPDQISDTLHIRFLPQPGAVGVDDLVSEQYLSWSGSNLVGLTSIGLDGTTGGGLDLELKFDRPVTYEVHPSSNFRSIKLVFPSFSASNSAAAVVPQSAPLPADDSLADLQIAPTVFVLHLASAAEPFANDVVPAALLNDYQFYQSSPDDGDGFRLRAGFFFTREEAVAVASRLQKDFPGAMVVSIPRPEMTSAQVLANADGFAPPSLTPDRLATELEAARRSVATRDFDDAIRRYTKLLESSNHEYRARARELLAVTREKKGQLARATAMYNQYLLVYPGGEGASRVSQRLAALTTMARLPGRPLIANDSTRDARASEWNYFGGISQYYRHDELADSDDEEIFSRDALTSDFDVNARRRSENWDINLRATAGYLLDMEPEGRDQTQVSSMYLDIARQNVDRQWSLRMGRQTRNTGGVLGRFDGAWFSMELRPDIAVNVVAGFPVDSSREGFDTRRQVLSANLELSGLIDSWDFLPFVATQRIEGITDRTAVGLETRYFTAGTSVLSLLDFDVEYGELNTFLLLGNVNLAAGLRASVNLDYRRSPILTTRNALQGQGLEEFDDLLDRFSEEEIRRLALDRTAESRSVTLGLSKAFSDTLQLNGDVTVSNLSATESSGGVEGLPGTGNEYFYSLQLVASNLLVENDVNLFGLRYSDTFNAITRTLTVNTRYNIGNKWRLNPRLRLDARENKINPIDLRTVAPSFRLHYLMSRRTRIELEAGGEWRSRETELDDEDTLGAFINLGYRADF